MRAAQAAALFALLALAPTLSAHEGHVHEAAPELAVPAVPVAPPPGDSPRLALSGRHLELVALRDAENGLLIYVDDYQSNAPLSGLSVQLRSGPRSVQAAPAAEGLYRVPAGVLPDHEALPLQFIVRGEHWQEQLDGVLTAEVQAPAHFSPPRATWLALSPLLLLPVLLLRRRRAVRV